MNSLAVYGKGISRTVKNFVQGPGTGSSVCYGSENISAEFSLVCGSCWGEGMLYTEHGKVETFDLFS